MENIEIFGIPFLKKGSGIHIKKENRGKFTDYCGGKITEECIQKGKNSPDPKIRKRATFAANSRRWSKKHQQGGELGGNIKPKPKFKWITSDAIGGKPRLVPYDYNPETNRVETYGPFGGGHFSGSGAGNKFTLGLREPYIEEKIDTLWVPVQTTFNEAFKNARNKGLSVFTFNGKQYNTQLGNNPKNWEYGQKRTVETLIPIEHKKKVTKYKTVK